MTSGWPFTVLFIALTIALIRWIYAAVDEAAGRLGVVPGQIPTDIPARPARPVSGDWDEDYARREAKR